MRNNPLDLNNLPDDFISKHPLDDSSSAASGIYRKKKNNTKDDRGKVYECRFCSLKFRKSQALGGHMNRHRQERETEALNQARQLVFTTDNIMLPQPPHQLAGGQPAAVNGGYHYAGFNTGGTIHPTTLFSGSSTINLHPPPQPHQNMYTSPQSRVSNTYVSQYCNSTLINDYLMDPCVSTSNPQFSFQNLSCATVQTHDHHS